MGYFILSSLECPSDVYRSIWHVDPRDSIIPSLYLVNQQTGDLKDIYQTYIASNLNLSAFLILFFTDNLQLNVTQTA